MRVYLLDNLRIVTWWDSDTRQKRVRLCRCTLRKNVIMIWWDSETRAKRVRPSGYIHKEKYN